MIPENLHNINPHYDHEPKRYEVSRSMSNNKWQALKHELIIAQEEHDKIKQIIEQDKKENHPHLRDILSDAIKDCLQIDKEVSKPQQFSSLEAFQINQEAKRNISK